MTWQNSNLNDKIYGSERKNEENSTAAVSTATVSTATKTTTTVETDSATETAGKKYLTFTFGKSVIMMKLFFSIISVCFYVHKAPK